MREQMSGESGFPERSSPVLMPLAALAAGALFVILTSNTTKVWSSILRRL